MTARRIRHPSTIFSRFYEDTGLAPKRGTIETTAGDRVIGRLFKVNLPGMEHNVLRDLAGDIFFALYKYDPHLVPKERLDADRLISRTLMEWLLQQPYYGLARSKTMLSLAASVGATRKVWEALLDDEMIQQLFDQMIKSEQMMGGMKSDQQNPNQQQSQSGQGQPQEQDQKSDDEVEKLRKEIEKKAEQLQNSGMLAALIDRAAKKGAEEGERVEGILRSWGLDQDSPGQNLSVEEISKLATTNLDSIAKIAEVIGRVAQTASKTMEQTKQGYVGPPTKVALTRDLSRILAFERIKMSPSAPPLMRSMQVAQYASQGLLGWQPASEGKKTGPFAAYIDTSGSMDGDKAYVAKALAFGLARTLMTDNNRQRNFRIRSFSDRGDITEYIDQDSPASKLFQWAEYNYGGGTDFDTPLEMSIKDLSAMKKEGTDGADLLIVTDGWGNLSDQVVKHWKMMARNTMGTRFMFIFIGSEGELQHGLQQVKSFRDMHSLADFFMHIDEHKFIENPEALAAKLIESMYIPKETKK